MKQVKKSNALVFIKNELQSTNYYCLKIINLNLKLEQVCTKLYEISGIDYSKSGDVKVKWSLIPKLDLMQKEELLNREIKKWRMRILDVEEVLNKCSPNVKDMLIRIYVLKESQSKVSESYNYSRTGMIYLIDKELSEVLKEYDI
ncbi:hypothetical protein AXI73_gp04 [Erysipelothrix amsterdamensis]|uniref:DUF1492 domain-containing protein n=1 Tax=Erysipelothrix amsterdamensis TaxID=2929157 RepID=A0AAU9VHR8_9FIRM|nr:hypothetical protein AXI73_gp04 [Erysipelothrix sp. A18Y020d]CAH2761988.1 hypothetical protein AXI73_gp04 [Erysipelothrix sp. A18Y020d]